jgi:hypothetical protein
MTQADRAAQPGVERIEFAPTTDQPDEVIA